MPRLDGAADLPRRVEWRAVPFIPQTPFHCGPAALATVLLFAGIQTSPDALAEALFLPAREGSLQLEMLAAARRAGALAVLLPPEFDALLREVAAGTPVVVLQNLGLAIAPRWHYAVVVGYDLDSAELVMRSGTTERERMGFGLFERTWARGERWSIAALPPGRLPLTAREADAAQAALGFERVAAPATSAKAYDSVLARWPDNAVAGLGRGNVAAAQGDWSVAASSFERVASRHDAAAAWHNLAIARARLGDTPAARQAAQRALSRARTSEPQWLDAATRLVNQLN